MQRLLRSSIAAAALAVSLGTARAHPSDLSDASALSMLPIAVSVAAPVALLAGGAALMVVSVTATAEGTVWVLERASDGARASVTFAGNVSAAVGTTIVVTAFSAGWILSAAGQVLAYIPNELGAALLYNERVTR